MKTTNKTPTLTSMAVYPDLSNDGSLQSVNSSQPTFLNSRTNSNLNLMAPNLRNHSTNTVLLMNKQVEAQDSLYYICLKLKKRLESVSQLKPYLNLAYSSAEVLSENQALSLSQRSSNHHSYSSNNRTSSSLRISALSSYSNLSEESSNNTSNSLPSSPIAVPLSTFHAGVLPATISCDPITQLWALFQQGSPLCVIFNIIKPAYSLTVISSDDLKTCKKSIYDFILACKNHLDFDNSDLFTISNVFSNETEDLIKIIKVINQVIDLAPSIFKPIEVDDQIKISDAKSKVIKELVETERKYVYDLETLSTYRHQLLENNIISSEDLYMLFPNLDDVLDFQRRVLVSLEINSLVDPSYQRIGSIFIHAQSFFKLYEPWSIGQKAAVDYISQSPLKITNNQLIIENEFELQSFLLKPVQRLCKYPLLLKSLLKNTDQSSPNYNELAKALEISKTIANDINENQRRVENVEFLKKLYDKVVDWKGYNVNSFGELLFFDKVIVKDNSKTSEERDFQVYLFENIIIFFKEIYPQQKKSSSLALKKKSQLNLLNQNEVIGLELKGRISIANIYSITAVNTRLLNISWSGLKDTGSFLMKFKNEETKSNWETCIRKIVSSLQEDYANSARTAVSAMSIQNTNDRRSNGFSVSSDRSSFATNISRSNSEVNSYHQRQKSEVITSINKRSTQDSLVSKRSVSESYKNALPNNSFIVKLMYEKDLFTIMIPLDITVTEFLMKIEKKIKQCGGTMKGKVKYQDEDGDFIVIQSEDDWVLVKEMIREIGEKVLNVWVA